MEVQLTTHLVVREVPMGKLLIAAIVIGVCLGTMVILIRETIREIREGKLWDDLD